MSMLPASFGATIVGAIQTGSGTYVTAFLVFLGVTAVVILLDLAFRGAAKNCNFPPCAALFCKGRHFLPNYFAK